MNTIVNATRHINDQPLFANFVTPSLCYKLSAYGLSRNVNYTWRIYPVDVKLCSYAFDEEKFYKDSEALMDECCPPECICPAYSVKDMEQCMPNYLLRMEHGLYTLSLVHDGIEIRTAKQRLPDVFAETLLKMVKVNLVKINHLNELLQRA